MRLLIYSDVHGNLPAFEAMLKAVGTCDQYICLGDLVNYGPWSNECVDLALSLRNSRFIMGNHEEAFLQGFYPGKNELVKKFFEMTHAGFTRKEEIAIFEQSFDEYGYRFQHTIGNANIYPDTTITLDRNYVIGHSHHQFVYKNSGHTLFNAGSVGQNRKYINVVNYLVFDKTKWEMNLCSQQYNLSLLTNKMRELDYPQECIDYYLKKERLGS